MPARASADDAAIGAETPVRPVRASDVPAITGLRLMPQGAAATLVNISASGVLAECALRLKVDTPVQVAFEGTFVPKSAAGRVARCEVAAMGRDGMIRYHLGIAFTEPIPFEASAPPPARVEAASGPSATFVPPAPPAAVPASPAVRNRW